MKFDNDDLAMHHARERVAEGVKVLDQKVPEWWKVIDLKRLDMANCHTCMLGQLFGYDTELAVGAAMHGLNTSPPPEQLDHNGKVRLDQAGYFRGCNTLNVCAADMGCNEAYGDDDQVGIGFDHLQCAWAEVIAERRAADDLQTEDQSECQTQ